MVPTKYHEKYHAQKFLKKFLFSSRALGTDPYNPDTDGDGLTDGMEITVTYTDPNRSDKGDVAPAGAPDGKVNLVDLLVLVRFVEGMATPSARDRILGDMNFDGVIDTRDILSLRRSLGY